MKKLLFVYDRMMTGGTTTALLSLLSELDYTQYEVDLILYSNEGPFLDSIPAQVRLLTPAYAPKMCKKLSMKRRKMLLFLLDGGLFRAAFSWLRHRNTHKGNLRDILASHSVKTQVRISRKVEGEYDAAVGFIEGWSDHYVLSKKVKAKKRIVWIHPDYAASYLLPEVDRRPFNKADWVVLVSGNCTESFRKVFPEIRDKAVTIENITSQEYIQKRADMPAKRLSGAEVKLGTVCRCDLQVKGLDRIACALQKLRDEGLLEGVVWHLIGDGKDLPAVKTMVSQLQLEQHVVFHGHSDNPLPLVRQLDGFVLASRYEGKPVAVTEALCLGVPCVVTNYASAHEQIQTGINGLVVDNDDHGIYEGLKTILQDRTCLKKLQDGVLSASYSNTEQIQKFYEIVR